MINWDSRVKTGKYMSVSLLRLAAINPRRFKAIVKEYGPINHKAEAEAAAKRLQECNDAYNTAVDFSFQTEFGRLPQAGDYKVSGIWRDEFSEYTKDVLREHCRQINREMDILAAHNLFLKHKVK